MAETDSEETSVSRLTTPSVHTVPETPRGTGNRDRFSGIATDLVGSSRGRSARYTDGSPGVRTGVKCRCGASRSGQGNRPNLDRPVGRALSSSVGLLGQANPVGGIPQRP